jgi:predicted ribosomally synthesized peptide with nif11-like leader
MSAMKELYLKVAADKSLQEKVNKIFEAAGEDADVAGKNLVEFAGEQGYTITVKELGKFFQAMSEAPDAELSEEELDAVAGGKVAGWLPTDLSATYPSACLVHPGG